MLRFVTLTMALALALAPLTTSAPAHAQQRVAAEALFQSGREAAQKGDWITACDRFEESNRLESAPGTILNIARCREQLGQVATAWQRYREASQKLPRGDSRVTLARKRAAQLEPRLPYVVLELEEVPAGTEIIMNGEVVGEAMLGVAIPVDPGAVKIEVKAPGHDTFVLELEMEEGKRHRGQLELGPAHEEASSASEAVTEEAAEGAGPAAQPADVAPSDDPKRTYGYVSAGVGVLGLGVGAVTGLLAIQSKNTMDDYCDGDDCRDQKGIDAANRGKTFSTTSTIGFAVGVVGVGLGAYFLLTADENGTPTTALGVQPLPGGAGMSFGGTL